MSDAPAPPTGRLFYVIGASGAGKDSVMREAAARLRQAPVIFAPRLITRAYDPTGENHVPVSPAAFERLLCAGCLAMHWQAHGLHYGIGRELLCWLQAGVDVVINGSRSYLATAADNFPELVPVLIEVRPEKLAERLRRRGRESETEIAKRLQRARAFAVPDHPRLLRIDNNGALTQAARALAEHIRR